MRDIPALRLSTLTKLIERFTRSPKLLLMKLFGEDKYPSDEILWEAQTGDRGMTPFSNEDAVSPRVVPTGVSEHRAMAAFWKEKMYFGRISWTLSCIWKTQTAPRLILLCSLRKF